jgi:hypothetical protein
VRGRFEFGVQAASCACALDATRLVDTVTGGAGERCDPAGQEPRRRATMKRLCALLILVPLAGGCDKKQDLAACRLEAARAHPGAKDEESMRAYTTFVKACLEAKGYTVNAPGE